MKKYLLIQQGISDFKLNLRIESCKSKDQVLPWRIVGIWAAWGHAFCRPPPGTIVAGTLVMRWLFMVELVLSCEDEMWYVNITTKGCFDEMVPTQNLPVTLTVVS